MATTMDEPVTRRDFIHIAATAFVGVGAAAALWPLVDQMNPDAAALSLASVELDLAPIQVGQAVTIMWRGKPIFVRNRTPEEIKAAQDVPLSDLKDPIARVMGGTEDAPGDRRRRGPNRATSSGWCRSASAPISAASRKASGPATTGANLAAGSARATAPNTTRRAASAKARRRAISKFRPMRSKPTQKSK